MKKKLLSQVVIPLVFLLSGVVQIKAQCVGPMSVPILGSGTGNSLSASESHTNAACAGVAGSATISAAGGTGPYTGTGTFSQMAGTVVYTVTDANNCTATVSVTVTATDVTPPSITCPTASLTVTPAPGECTVTAGSEYNPAVSDNCGISSTAYTTVSGSVSPATGSSLAGAVLGPGANVIQWTVTDVGGLTNTCQFTVTVNPCVTITGTLLWKGDAIKGVGQATVTLSGDASDTDVTLQTPLTGNYILVANMGSNFSVKPTKNINLLNGLDVADAVSIQQHLTNIAPITDFYRLVAADVNKSYTISTVDAAILRQAILGNPSAVAIMNATKSWRFIPTSYTPGPFGPYNLPVFPETRTLSGVSGAVTGQDFYGVKTGDVLEAGFPGPGPGIANPALKPDPSAKPLIWRVRDRPLTAGETAAVDFTVMNFTDIAAYQFAMSFETDALKLDHIDVLTTGIALNTEDHFGAYNIANGELRTLWSTANSATLSDITPVFRLHFKVLQNGKLSNLLRIDPSVMASVAYNSVLSPRELQLLFVDYKIPGPRADLAVSEVELLQNRPNPFSEATSIGFILPEACDAQLRVFDISGREILRIDKSYPAGYNEETIRLDGATASGVLYYELTTPWGKQARKMLPTGK